MHQAILSVGSNTEPQKYCHQSEIILATDHRLLDTSAYILTAPVGYQDQDDFLNGAFWVETHLDYSEFNQYLKAVEKQLGRVKRPIKAGPQTIDLDIIIWDGHVVRDDFYNKDYVRIPVKELLDRHGISIIESQVLQP
ncbi:MAG: 2-amino-4-hydroxy-6-hydroxymethyldihydropteridine diphosphokinase [Limnothrix sp. BL-A-16]|jgi:2-amino-4-hydroxy-6-hydroxymethyldihydropteridine diphosphokinase